MIEEKATHQFSAFADSQPPLPYPDRRSDQSTNTLMIRLINQVHAAVETLRKEVEEIAKTHAAAIADLKTSAFPAGDPDGHRRHHEAVIKAAEDRAKFWAEMRIAAAKPAFLGVLVLLGTMLWNGLLDSFLKFLAHGPRV